MNALIEAPPYLHNFIGLSETFSTEPPKSGLYLDLLEGLNVLNIADLTDEVMISARSITENKCRHAALKTLDRADVALRRMLTVARHSPQGYTGKPLAGTFGNTLDTGVRLMRTAPADKAQLTYIASIEVYPMEAGEITIYVRDEQLNTIATFTANAHTPGEAVQVAIDRAFAPRKLYITSTARLQIIDLRNPSGCCGHTHNINIPSLVVQGYKDGSIDMNFGEGFRVDACVQCSITPYYEAMARLLKQAILYQTGIEVVREWMASTRLNALVINGAEHAHNVMLPSFMEEYEIAFEQGVAHCETLLSQSSSYCFSQAGIYTPQSLVP